MSSSLVLCMGMSGASLRQLADSRRPLPVRSPARRAPLSRHAAAAASCSSGAPDPSSAARKAAGQQQRQQPQQQPALQQPGLALPSSQLGFALLSLGAALLAPCSAALAAEAEAVAYNPGGGSDTLKALAGAGYIVVVVIYFVGLFARRAKTATSQVRGLAARGVGLCLVSAP